SSPPVAAKHSATIARGRLRDRETRFAKRRGHTSTAHKGGDSNGRCPVALETQEANAAPAADASDATPDWRTHHATDTTGGSAKASRGPRRHQKGRQGGQGESHWNTAAPDPRGSQRNRQGRGRVSAHLGGLG